jgi:hypothetical protein
MAYLYSFLQTVPWTSKWNRVHMFPDVFWRLPAFQSLPKSFQTSPNIYIGTFKWSQMFLHIFQCFQTCHAMPWALGEPRSLGKNDSTVDWNNNMSVHTCITHFSAHLGLLHTSLHEVPHTSKKFLTCLSISQPSNLFPTLVCFLFLEIAKDCSILPDIPDPSKKCR